MTDPERGSTDPSRRRQFLRGCGLLGTAGLAGCLGGDAPAATGTETRQTPRSEAESPSDGGDSPTDDGPSETTATDTQLPDSIATEPLATGFTSPVGVELPAGVDGRAYVVDQAGTVSVVTADGSESTFLDVRDRMVSVGGYTEQGLLGMAFHPDFPDDDRVFVRYSSPPRDGTPNNYSHTFVLAEFRATADAADPDSERALLEIPEPQGNHNAGSVVFGPDGFLYVGVGDGGGANDRGTGHVEDWYDAVPGGNGQDVTENLLGSVLRIDVDGGGRGEYTVPDDNPLVGREGLDEQFAWGFRNPWRMSFDRETGDFYVADVGQNEWEEVSRVVAGGNYGWNVREATHCFGAEECPTTGPDGEPLRDPVIEYPHSGEISGISVIGGYRYRGDGTPELAGRYVFADWRASGSLFVATPQERLWPISAIPMDGSVGSNVLAFGEDPAGELYVCTTNESGVRGETGTVHRITGV